MSKHPEGQENNWYPKPVEEMTQDELHAWLKSRPQLFVGSVEHDGMSLSIPNPDLQETANENGKPPRKKAPKRAKRKT